MVWLKNSFNKSESTFVHLDVNSCFATLEQQANPLFRNKPLVVTAYSGRKGCVLASSTEGKRLGIKTGMRLEVAQKIYPNLISIVSDPNKYRFIHLQIK
jgi:DNA polymerase-4